MAKKKSVPLGKPTVGEETLEEYLNRGGSLMEWTVAQNVKAARAGDTDAAREILQDFVGAVEQRSARSWHEMIYWEYARYLADAFSEILAGKDPAVALGVKSSRPGRRKGKTTHDEEALAAAYWFLRRQKYRPERAIEALARETGADRRTIQRAAKAKGNLAFSHEKLLSEDDLKDVMKPYAAQIKSILAAESR